MDALEFLKKVNDICDNYSHGYCKYCPINDYCGCSLRIDEPEEYIAVVENWRLKNRSLIEKIRYSSKYNEPCPEWVYRLIEAEVSE